MVRQLDHPTTCLPSMPNQRLPNNPRLRKTSMTTTITETTCDGNPTCFHPKCKHCDTPVRSKTALKKDHPGTLRGSIKTGICIGCITKHGSETPKPLWWLGKPCKGCGQTLRRSTQSIN